MNKLVKVIAEHPISERGRHLPGDTFMCSEERIPFLKGPDGPWVELVEEDEVSPDATPEGTETEDSATEEEWPLDMEPRAYVKQYPTGPNADHARALIAKEDAEAEAEEAEDEAEEDEE